MPGSAGCGSPGPSWRCGGIACAGWCKAASPMLWNGAGCWEKWKGGSPELWGRWGGCRDPVSLSQAGPRGMQSEASGTACAGSSPDGKNGCMCGKLGCSWDPPGGGMGMCVEACVPAR